MKLTNPPTEALSIFSARAEQLALPKIAALVALATGDE